MKYLWRISVALAGFLTLVPPGGTQAPAIHMRQVAMEKVPAIGAPIEAPMQAVRNLCLVNSAQFDPCVEATIDGIKYTVSYRNNNGGNSFVTRVYTSDAKFISPEGLRVGDEITVNGPEDLFEAPYFEVYARKGSKWIPIIGLMGMVNVTFDGKQIAGDAVQTLWSGGRKPVILRISGFIEN
ncbi:MAG TPA: hypothetical protein VGE85_03650 [Terracidiphilus sp.]|jgi:hypothetical protein